MYVQAYVRLGSISILSPLYNIRGCNIMNFFILQYNNACAMYHRIFPHNAKYYTYHSLEKFTVGYFCVRIICGKIFLSLEVSDEKFLTMSNFLFRCSQTYIMHNYT